MLVNQLKCCNRIIVSIVTVISISVLTSCAKIKEARQDPEISPLKDGFKVSAAIGYCASLANTLFHEGELPENVLFQASNNNEFSGAGIMYVTINNKYPVPFNSNSGQILISCLWDKDLDDKECAGVMSAIFTDIRILEPNFEFIGIYTVPVIQRENENLMTIFAEQDIIVGEGSDTLINLSLTKPQFNIELDRLGYEQPNDVFVAVKQNVWFITIDQNNTFSDVYDDEFLITGGGQIAGATSVNGGILYHAMIGTKFNYTRCDLNPFEGVGFIQNLKVGQTTDLGHIFLNFHKDCDGKAFVEFATGKYITSNRRNVNINFY